MVVESLFVVVKSETVIVESVPVIAEAVTHIPELNLVIAEPVPLIAELKLNQRLLFWVSNCPRIAFIWAFVPEWPLYPRI